MRQVGRKIGQANEGFLKPGQHGVEGSNEFGQFGRKSLGQQARVQPTRGHFLGPLPDRLQRSQPATHGKMPEYADQDRRQADDGP